MAYEALIVIGFGVALAVVSVGLFVAHVKRINAPNKADPTGTVVQIQLGTALAKDEAARNRKASARGSSGKDVRVRAKDAAFDLQPNGPGRRRKRSVPSADGSSVDKPDSGESSTIRGAVEKDTQACLGQGDAAPPYVATMVLPSPLWAEAMVKHADVKRKKLRGMVKSGEIAAGWEAKWARLPPLRRRRLLEAVREELVHAVSSYIGGDLALFDAICPNLSVGELEDHHRGVSGLSRLVRGCLDGKLPEPRSKAFAAVQEALAKASAAAAVAADGSEDKRTPVRAFLPTFRKLCSSSFCIGALEAIVRGRADGTAGPTLGSFCTALVKTGGSSVVLFAFFHGLKQMSSSDVDSSPEGLPVAD
ncbi:unnamed protein product [Scytosiphon promiscuus]